MDPLPEIPDGRLNGHGTRALVLSAGGMFGAWQAGAWLELAAWFKPDIVVGASVGSLNAWHIASGWCPDAIVQRWLGLRNLAEVRWRLPRRLSDGILDNSILEQEIRDLCAQHVPVRRLGVVLTRTRTLTPTLFEWPNLEWTHVAASCGVPVFLRNYQIAGEWYSDGGLVDPLPLRGAIAMGARQILAVNALKHRPWPIRMTVRGLRRWAGYVPPKTGEISVMEVSPESALGPARDSMYWTPETAGRLIERGRKDALRMKPAIVQWSEREIRELGNVPYPSSA